MKTWFSDNDPVFLSQFMICLGGTKRQAFDRYCWRLGLDPETQAVGPKSDCRQPYATAFTKPGFKSFAIWIRDETSGPTSHAMSIIAHEALHATYFIMEGCGLVLADESDEAFCYYLGYVVQEIYKRLWPEAE